MNITAREQTLLHAMSQQVGIHLVPCQHRHRRRPHLLLLENAAVALVPNIPQDVDCRRDLQLGPFAQLSLTLLEIGHTVLVFIIA